MRLIVSFASSLLLWLYRHVSAASVLATRMARKPPRSDNA
jgi:hypothetical protein